MADINADGAQETAQSITDAGGTATAVHVDVSDSDSVTEALLQTVDEFGAIEILVNCAGWDDFMPFSATDEAFWDRIIEINYKGTLRTVHGCIGAMTEAGWGRIVNIGSDAGRVGSSLESVYSGAKGGVIAFTKTINFSASGRGRASFSAIAESR